MPAFPPLPPSRWLFKPVPALIRNGDRLVPFVLKKQLIGRVLNHLLKMPLEEGEFDFLGGRQLGLRVNELNLSLAFTCENDRLQVLPAHTPDAWIRGNARDFLQLANRSEDPDTLFFQRRLTIEGDTELGLAVKNLLDSIDWSELPGLFRHGLQMMQRTGALSGQA